MPEWRFKKMSREDPVHDPIQDEFFTTDSVGGLLTALVREFIQNALDARAPDEDSPVRIVFNLSNMNRRAQPALRETYLSRLSTHLFGNGSGLVHKTLREVLDRGLNFIVIEDFGTTGLEGDPDETHEEVETDGQDNRRHDFFWFWRNFGRSGKTAQQLGRWGAGKSAFAALSHINTFFGVTVRRSDRRKLMMGLCILKTHTDSDLKTSDSRKCCPFGYFAEYPDNSTFPRAIDNREFIEKFCRDFGLKRGNEPGFSIVIPYPRNDQEIPDRDWIVASIIKQWFWPILNRRLELNLIDQHGDSLTINADHVRNFPTDDTYLKNLVSLAAWAAARKNINYVKITPNDPEKPKWNDITVADGREEVIEDARRKFNRGEPVAFRMRVSIVRTSGGETSGTEEEGVFSVFLQKQKDGEYYPPLAIRGDILIPNALSGNRPKRETLGILVADDHNLASFLGDAENPAHTEWQTSSSKFKDKYEYGSDVLRFIKRSVSEIDRMLTPPATGINREILDDIFFLEESEDSGKSVPGRYKSGPAPEDIKSGRHVFTVSPVTDGFRVTLSRKHAYAVKKHMEAVLEVAYDMRGGDPFKNYSTDDFELNRPPVNLVYQGCEIRTPVRNRLEFRITDPDGFFIQVTGFDHNRDLKIRLNLKETAEGAE